MADQGANKNAVSASGETEHPGESPPAVEAHPAIERLLAYQEGREDQRAPTLAPGLHVGTLLELNGRRAVVSVDGARIAAHLAEHVDADFLAQVVTSREPVLLQHRSDVGPCILGIIQGRHPAKLVGQHVEVIGTSEVVVKSGKSALRLREDGVVDLIGARISASSRGLLRLVGRALRLN